MKTLILNPLFNQSAGTNMKNINILTRLLFLLLALVASTTLFGQCGGEPGFCNGCNVTFGGAGTGTANLNDTKTYTVTVTGANSHSTTYPDPIDGYIVSSTNDWVKVKWTSIGTFRRVFANVCAENDGTGGQP